METRHAFVLYFWGKNLELIPKAREAASHCLCSASALPLSFHGEAAQGLPAILSASILPLFSGLAFSPLNHNLPLSQYRTHQVQEL